MGFEKQKDYRPGSRYSIDSFCKEIAEYFESQVKGGRKYCGLYLHTSDGFSQIDLNNVREVILSKFQELNELDLPIIASICPPTNLERYEPKFPNREGWYIVDIGWFVNKGLLGS